MNVHKAISDYVTRILGVNGMKVLLLDKETTSIVASVYSQSDIISRQVFLVERVDIAAQKAAEESKDTMHHLKAVCFIRPTTNSINHMRALLKSSKYKEYHIFFSNIVSTKLLQRLAEGDINDLVRQVEEYFGDYYVLDNHLFHCNLPLVKHVAVDHDYDRTMESVLSVLLSLKTRAVIRYEGTSAAAKSMASALTSRMKIEGDLFYTQSETTLLILDRRDDPVTPLLQQWTYQAMVHEILGIDNNRVDLRKAGAEVKKELQEVVLNPQQDHFYKGSMFLNFGELGVSVKELVTNYQRKAQDNSNLDSIQDMQNFVDKYPEFRQLAGNVSKHVTVMTELSRVVESRKLMEVSGLEQELACNSDHNAALQELTRILRSSSFRFAEKLRLVMLYALRYEGRKNETQMLKERLREAARSDKELSCIRAVDEVLLYAGNSQRGGDLFGNKSLGAKASRFFSSALKGVENIYTQHRPLLVSTLEQLFKGKLKPTAYPFMDSSQTASKAKVTDVVVFIIGGITYEEHAAVTQMMKEQGDPSCRVVLGGSCVLNTSSFVDSLLR